MNSIDAVSINEAPGLNSVSDGSHSELQMIPKSTSDLHIITPSLEHTTPDTTTVSNVTIPHSSDNGATEMHISVSNTPSPVHVDRYGFILVDGDKPL